MSKAMCVRPMTIMAAVLLATLMAVLSCHSRVNQGALTLESAPAPSATLDTTGGNPSGALGDAVIPRPVLIRRGHGEFPLMADSVIFVDAPNDEVRAIGEALAAHLRPATGFDLPVRPAGRMQPPPFSIQLTTFGADALLGDEGYEIRVTTDSLVLRAPHPAGLFRGIQTIRQLLPPAIESAAPQPGPWAIAAGTIRDYPRFEWRGAMLDVSRHFFSVEDVKRYIDLMAYYKLNRFHMHLSDDQGWRIEIHSWPNLTVHGGSSGIHGSPGGFFTQGQYADIVAYAQARYIIVVPEIDMPSHTNAALASYPELNCSGEAPPLYTGQEVGFSTLCVDKEITYQFVDDVIRELAALTPGPWIHVGGDEAHVTPKADYIKFVTRVQQIVASHGKQMVGWEEIAQIELAPGSVAQHWSSDLAQEAARQGNKVIMSPSRHAYIDMKYHRDTKLGLRWAGYVEVRRAYEWDPATQVPGVRECDVLGVEAPLWSETLETIADIEFMAYPRLIGHAEIGWSPAWGRHWAEYRERLARHGKRLEVLGVNFYRSPQVDW